MQQDLCTPRAYALGGFDMLLSKCIVQDNTTTLMQRDDTTLEVTELPIRKWTQDYKEFLETLVKPEDKNSPALIEVTRFTTTFARQCNLAQECNTVCHVPFISVIMHMTVSLIGCVQSLCAWQKV